MKIFIKFVNGRFFAILLFLFMLAYIVVTYIYLRANTAPPRWDDSMYLQQSEIMFNAIHGNVLQNPMYLTNLASVYIHLLGGSHAPLIALLPIPSYFIFGTGFPGLVATFFVLLVAFNWIFYRFVSEIADKPTALLAVVITSTMPLTVGLSRYFLVEYGLTIFTVMWVYLQIKSNHFCNGRYNIWMGIVLGLGMLMKITFPLYIIGPIIWGIVTILINTKFGQQAFFNVLRNGMIIFLGGMLLMGTWYLPNLKHMLTFAFNAGFGRSAQAYSIGNPFGIRVLLNYWLGVIIIGISAYYFFILIFLIVAKEFARVFNKKQSTSLLPHRLQDAIWIIFVWFLVPFIVFSFGVNKDIRFMLPAFPPIGLIIARLMVDLFYKTNFGKALIALLIGFPGLLFGYTSLPLSSNYYLQVGPFLMVAPQIGYASRPTSQTWPLEQMLFTINEDAKENNLTNTRSSVVIGVVPNHEYFNVNNLGYFSVHHNLPFLFEWFEPPLNNDWTIQKDRIISKDYLIAKTDDQGPSFAYNPYLNPLLLDGDLPFKEIARFKLPDGSDGIIYKNKRIR